jgi:hypothetical protein
VFVDRTLRSVFIDDDVDPSPDGRMVRLRSGQLDSKPLPNLLSDSARSNSNWPRFILQQLDGLFGIA